MTTRKRIASIFLVLALMITLGGELLSAFGVRASAAFSKETGVLEDLEADSTFDSTLYPADSTNFSLKVFQLAEGETGDIYIYVYQPSASFVDITATSINISNTGTAVGLRKCDLKLIDKSGVFHKYQIQGMSRLNDFVREYFIVSIYRPWNELLGDSTSDEGTIGVEVACPVETIWTATTSQLGDVSYSARYSEDTITVTSEVLGSIIYKDRYSAPVSWFTDSYIKSHFLAFSTNKPIDSLKKVYLDYEYYDYYRNGTYIDKETGVRSVTLTDEDVFKGLLKDSIFYEKYSYERIQDTSTFIANEGEVLTDSAFESISSEDWILRYTESSYLYQYIPGTYETTEMYTNILGVSMLRMEYLYEDKYYDVGIIADVLTEDDIADGYVEAQPWWLKLMAILAVILVILLYFFFKPVIDFFVNIVLWLFKKVFSIISVVFNIVLWVISIPFRLLRFLFKQ